jgi:hypothetical protein
MYVELTSNEIDMICDALSTLMDVVPDDPTGTSYELVSKLRNYQEDYIMEALSLNEDVQILDKVKYGKETGFVTGQIEGKMIVQVQGSTYLVDPKDLKQYNKKPDIITQPHMKFDEKTQKLLFEQYVKCGVFYGNVPIKVSDCYVKYSNWESVDKDKKVKVLVEGNVSFIPKSQIQIFEDPNDFANEENYVPGVIIDEATEEVIENILVNAIDYTNAIGDADAVKIIKTIDTGEQEMQTAPKSMIRTLSV